MVVQSLEGHVVQSRVERTILSEGPKEVLAGGGAAVVLGAKEVVSTTIEAAAGL